MHGRSRASDSTKRTYPLNTDDWEDIGQIRNVRFGGRGLDKSDKTDITHARIISPILPRLLRLLSNRHRFCLTKQRQPPKGGRFVIVCLFMTFMSDLQLLGFLALWITCGLLFT